MRIFHTSMGDYFNFNNVILISIYFVYKIYIIIHNNILYVANENSALCTLFNQKSYAIIGNIDMLGYLPSHLPGGTHLVVVGDLHGA